MAREDLWSPQMRRWLRDASQHGKDVRLFAGVGGKRPTPVPPGPANPIITQAGDFLLTQGGDNIVWA